MIIINQDETGLLNYENLVNIYIEYNEDIFIEKVLEPIKYLIMAVSNSKYIYNLGKYKTKERATEVLKEISEKYISGNYYAKISDNEWNKTETVYKMPKE